jgi:hypothetical protein
MFKKRTHTWKSSSSFVEENLLKQWGRSRQYLLHADFDVNVAITEENLKIMCCHLSGTNFPSPYKATLLASNLGPVSWEDDWD